MAEDDDLARAVEQDARARRAELLTVPGVSSTIAAGFTPLEELTGAVELAGVWPEAHIRVVADTRSAPWDQFDLQELDSEDTEGSEPAFGDGKVYLVRSPWPSIDLEMVLKLAYRWRRRNEKAFSRPGGPLNDTVRRIDPNALKDVDRTFFAQPESWILAYSRGRVNRLH